MSDKETQQTIADFGDQWARYTDNSGYYGSEALFKDIVAPLLEPGEVSGRRVAEIGSGTGRIVEMLLGAGAAHVTAIEPSRAFDLLMQRFSALAPRVTCHNVRGEAIESLGPFDLVFSIGVLHHIPDPAPVVAAARKALVPGGRFVGWVYGREGNGVYLALVQPLRAITKRLPDWLLEAVVRTLYVPLVAYIWLCRRLPLPMRGYVVNVIGRMAPDKRRLIIFDQLNPAYAKYYTRNEAEKLFSDAGFSDIRLYQRHGYSWTIIGTNGG